MFNGAKVLVTGGAGFVGSNLVKRLVKEGARVRATTHIKKPQIKDKAIDYVSCDLTLAKDCQRVVAGSDYVFICSANTSGAGVIQNTPLAHVTPNVLMNTLILDAAYQSKAKKVLFISSNTVYPVTDYPVKEGDVTNEFFDKYFCVAWMKRFSEILCQMYSDKISNKMATVVVRPANIYGPYDDFEWETSHVLPALIRKAVERHRPINVWGDGNDLKDFIYIDDFIDGLLLAMEKLDKFMPINIASGQSVTIRQALEIITKAAGYPDPEIIFDSSKPTMIPKRLIDSGLAEKILGFKPKISFTEGIKRTVAWYINERANG